ncbi:MAG TPA: zinc ribbon domain-containing protein [Candidatus Aphodovivens avistercoris]|nr:zinc ribbon domain-containing protein [Candidatus Aphodovivens avistercoris]
MFCPKCGNTLPDGAGFCNKCGAKLAARPAAAPARPAGAEVPGAKDARAKAGAAPSSNTPSAPAAGSSKPPLSVFRIVSIAFASAAVLCAFLPWFVPDGDLVRVSEAASGLVGLFAGGSSPSISFDSSYALWQLPFAIGEGQRFIDFMGPLYVNGKHLVFYVPLMWVPFVLWLVAIALLAVGIAKAVGRSGGKAFFVSSSLAMLAACIVFWISNSWFSMVGYAESQYPVGLAACLVVSFASLVVAAASRGKAKEQALAEAERQGVAGEVG